MKKREEKLKQYVNSILHQFIASNYENSSGEIKNLTDLERIDFVKNGVGLIFLFQYLKSNKQVYFGFTNVFKLFSNELVSYGLDSKISALFILDLVKDYPDKLFEFQKEDTSFDYVALVREYTGKYFGGNDILKLCEGDSSLVHERIISNSKVLEADINSKKLDAFYSINSINKLVQQIRKSYFDKKDSFDENDLEIVCTSLKDLGVATSILVEIETYLADKCKRKVSSTPANVKSEQKRKSMYISDKEYRDMMKKIKQYYNPYTWKLTDELLTSEEREHIASLMVRLGLESEQIADFLKKTETVGKTYSYDYFKDHIGEFEYYFGEELNQVFEYMKEIENCTSEEDKEYWIMGIDEELAKLEYSCKLSSYEYEVKLMKEVKE